MKLRIGAIGEQSRHLWSLHLWPNVADSDVVDRLTAGFRCSGYGYSGTTAVQNHMAVTDECLNTVALGQAVALPGLAVVH